MTSANPASGQIRVRFAPSPTGLLHIGGARTALFNFLYARANHGKFLLRIEDTDRERSEDRFTADILESLKWLGLDWDEEPVYQSHRFDRYRKVAEELLGSGLAYRCDCTPAALDVIRTKCQAEKKPFRYPGTCRQKQGAGPNSVVRVRVSDEGETGFEDLIRGPISFANKDIDDWVICRADGSPTYNFSVVIDDHDQGMTHVLRGDDHINNTPKQILLYKTLGFVPPYFAHLPMILGADRTKLSKRHGAGSTLDYRQAGYLPGAVINFLVRLGWSHGDQEIFSMEDLFRYFSLDHIGKSGAVFNTEKLDWISGHYMRSASPEFLQQYVARYFQGATEFLQGIEANRLQQGIAIIQGKVKTVLELIEQLKCLFGEDPEYDTAAIKPEERTRLLSFLTKVRTEVSASDFTKADLESRVRAVAVSAGEKLSPFAQAIRFAVTGGRISPALFEMLEVQGRDTVLRRLARAEKVLA